ncbi:MAG: hypothetical protein L0387_12715 [Acidobacteria bacterium]|nr:hypothetical protein [Acidobacteriota bacterium]MCI0622502.1 hypothetical protein [Acidobacteriota bacterium]MCI0722644.1 hypothetical protein [Acidobacteriota bacterium]
MIAALLLAALPMLFWDQGPETAAALKQNGVEQVVVPAERLPAWKASGLAVRGVTATEWSALEELATPGVDRQVQVAGATRSPYLIANGWRFARNRTGRYRYALPVGKAALAAAEAFAHSANATLQPEAADLEALGKMLAFLGGIPQADLPDLAEVAVVDDGHPLTGEVMNLLARRNLLFRAVSAPDTRYPVNIRIGSKEYPEEEAANPSEFALKIRRQLTDERRLLRIYGSETVLCRLTGDETRLRLHLLNYRGGKIDGLRVRLRGAFRKGQARGDQFGELPLEDFTVSDGATEFSLPAINVYAVVDLPRAGSQPRPGAWIPLTRSATGATSRLDRLLLSCAVP